MMYNTGNNAGTASALSGSLSVERRQPVWMTLDEARERAFTGEIVFEVDPEVLAYFDNGVVYYAERVNDLPLAQRLLDAGVIDAEQLVRGTVRVGEVDHLGRLFERDDSVDRDAVLVVTETSTEALIAELANREIASARVTAYRHHPSGVHRWFVAQRDRNGAARPVVELPQLGDHAVDELPGLALLDDDDLLIEWDEPFDGFEQSESPFAVDEFELDVDAEFVASLEASTARLFEQPVVDPVELDAVVAIEIVGDTDDRVGDFELAFAAMETEHAAVEADPHTESVEALAAADSAVDSLLESAIEEAVGDFDLVWPDGRVVSEPVAESPEPPATDRPVSPFAAAPDGSLRFAMPALELRAEPDVDDVEVPDEVAEAVRRAIAAIESATSEVPVINAASAPQLPAADAEIVVTGPTAASFGGFAPPTMDMRAEVLYGELEAHYAAEAEAEAAAWSASDVAEAAEPDVHVDGNTTAPDAPPLVETSGGEDERRSALRRLIGSLRRKDR